MEFKVPAGSKKLSFGLIGGGLLALILGLVFVDHHGHLGQRVWSNLLVNGYFFFAISLGCLFFLALQYAVEAGWSVVLKRIFEGVIHWMPIGMGVLAVVFLAGNFHLGGNHLYHWMDHDVMDPNNKEKYDALIAGKEAYLNPIFFWIRTVVYFAVFYLFWRGFRKRSLLEDQQGGTVLHFQNFKKAAIFLVLFGVFSSTSSWDWLMSIDTHWFSTLYGWYVFAGFWCTAMTVCMVLVLFLKGKGYLKEVNDSHIHDLGKWIFATSFLWSYLWFSQFMLIWYADIPEEVTYYVARIENYKGLFFTMFAINFVVPMLLLMSADAKRHAGVLMFVCSIIFVGHWFDTWLLVTPGTMFEHGSYTLVELGMFLVFLGAFIYVVLNALTKAPLVPVNHPYKDESLHHHF